MASNQKITVKEINSFAATKSSFAATKSSFAATKSSFAATKSRLKAIEKNYAKLLEFTKESMKRFNKLASDRNNEDGIQNIYGILGIEIEQQLQDIGELSEDNDEVVQECDCECYITCDKLCDER